MEKLAGVRVSGEWERALVDCVGGVPGRTSRRRRDRVMAVVLAVVVSAGGVGLAVWVWLCGGLRHFIH